jgi:hypothetical protein
MLMPFYLTRLKWIQGWVSAASELNIMFSTFEEFVRDRETFIESYLEFYGAPRHHFSYEDATRVSEGIDYHYRLGLIDEWRKVFPPDLARDLNELLPLAYESDSAGSIRNTQACCISGAWARPGRLLLPARALAGGSPTNPQPHTWPAANFPGGRARPASSHCQRGGGGPRRALANSRRGCRGFGHRPYTAMARPLLFSIVPWSSPLLSSPGRCWRG